MINKKETFSQLTQLEYKGEKIIINTFECFNVYYTHVCRYLKGQNGEFQSLGYAKVSINEKQAKENHKKTIKQVEYDLKR